MKNVLNEKYNSIVLQDTSKSTYVKNLFTAVEKEELSYKIRDNVNLEEICKSHKLVGLYPDGIGLPSPKATSLMVISSPDNQFHESSIKASSLIFSGHSINSFFLYLLVYLCMLVLMHLYISICQ